MRVTRATDAGTLSITDDRDAVDIDAVHAFLSRSYWAAGIPKGVVERAVSGSLCFSLKLDGRQVGFARAVTDRATFAYFADVYVLEEFQGQGLATWLFETIMAHPDLQGLRRFGLVTRDAHGLYRKFGFRELGHPERHMELTFPGIYRESRE